MEFGVLIARYKRHESHHDETHAFLMGMSFVAGLACDIWYVIVNFEELFKNEWEVMKFWFIVGVTVFFLAQISKTSSQI